MLPTVRVRVLQGLLLLATLGLFSRSLLNGFVDYDDPDYVTGNPHVRAGLSWAGARWALTSGEAANWHPLTWLSHMADAQLYGLNPAGHHATSVGIHALNAVLVFMVLRRLTGADWPAAFSAALFAWHPLRVESVSWVAERKDVLSLFFGLLTLLAYGAYAARRRRGLGAPGAYAAALVCFAAGLMCKPMLVTLPFVLLLLDVWPLRRLGPTERDEGEPGADRPGRWDGRQLRGLLAEKIPLFLLTGASCVITYKVQQAGNAMVEHPALGARLVNAAVSVARYIGAALWPAHLSIAYPLPAHWPAATAVGGALVVVGGSALALCQLTRRPWLAVGWFWFLGTLVPVVGIVQVGLQAMADRYTYLPCLGLEIAGVWTLADWAGSVTARRRALACGAVLILGLCAVQTWRRQAVWRSSLALYGNALAVEPDNYLTQELMGTQRLGAKDYPGAEACYRRAIDLKPDYVRARYRLGIALERQGRTGEAAQVYGSLLLDSPACAPAHYGLALILMDKGRLAEAAVHFKAALERRPAPALWIDLGTVEERLGRPGQAAEAFRQALVLDPGNSKADFGLATALEDLGRPDEALAFYARAAVSDPQSATARYNMGTLLLAGGHLEEALSQFSAALGLKRDFAPAWVGAGLVELKLGRPARAVRLLEQALRLSPGTPGVLEALGQARRATAHP